jgi:hypothetical protein
VGNGTGALAICGSTSRMESSVHPIYCEAASMGKQLNMMWFSAEHAYEAFPANEEGMKLFPPTRKGGSCSRQRGRNGFVNSRRF